ncbi:MAG: UDP-N-acetylmuramate--L-alanine ligase [Patescibacteria group bacterium]
MSQLKLKFKNAKNIYFIGIKGVGMTAVAQILQAQGKIVAGSDTHEKFFTDKVLTRAKIKFSEGFAAANLSAKIDLVIRSSAYTVKNNAEVAAAIKRKLPIMTQAEALAELFNDKDGIAVCGSHGKTTTSAMLGFVLHKIGLKPTVEVGSSVPQFGGNAVIGKGKIMVIEADEYQNKLKLYQPKIVLVNNIDYDHPDFFKTPARYQKAFADFVKKVPRTGFVVANFDDKNVKAVCKNIKAKIITYNVIARNEVTKQSRGISDKQRDCHVVPRSSGLLAMTEEIKDGFQYFQIWQGNQDLGEFKIKLIGEHNVQNATAVIAACLELKLPLAKIKQALAQFSGTERRMQVLGKYRGALFIDDYAHHPTEIKATLSALRARYPKQNIICAFMPHMFSRTKVLLDDFSKSFDNADEILILPTYSSARENKIYEISEDLVKKIKERCHSRPSRRSEAKADESSNDIDIKYLSSIKSCADYLKSKVKKQDVVVLMGAGDTFRVWDTLLSN